MAIFYKVIERKDPRNPDGPGKFYASNVSFGVIETEKLAENIAARSGHSVGQLTGLFQDYFRRIENYVVAGKTVSMAPLGTIIRHSTAWEAIPKRSTNRNISPK